MDPYRDLKTLRHDLTIDRGVSFEAAMRRLDFERKARALLLKHCWLPGILLAAHANLAIVKELRARVPTCSGWRRSAAALSGVASPVTPGGQQRAAIGYLSGACDGLLGVFRRATSRGSGAAGSPCLGGT